MNISNELKVGLTLVVAAIIFYIGVQYFQDIPIFKGTYQLETAFDDAGGLVKGNAVQINGVRVGAIDAVQLRADSEQAHVLFHINKGITVPKGSRTEIGGFAALGSVHMNINRGTLDTTTFQPGEFVPSTDDDTGLLARAPELVDKVDTLLVGANAALGNARRLLDNPDSDLRQTLVAIRGSAAVLNDLLRTEQDRLASVLAGVDTLMGNLGQVTGDSLQQTVEHLNQVLTRLDRNLAALESTTSGLNVVVDRIERGEGTLGMLINDPGLYQRLDSTFVTLNRVLLDFEKNPKRYLKDLKLVDVF